MKKFFEHMRNRFHPLHRLRKSRLFRERLLPALDFDLAVRGEFAQKIYVKAITHSSYYLASGAVEPHAKQVFLALLDAMPAEKRFFDVGANIGIYTWLAAGARPEVRIITFEPDPENFRLLTKTNRAWKRANIKLLQMGVSREKGQAVFQRDLVTSATGSLEPEEAFAQRHFQATGEKIQVPITTLDLTCDQEGPPGLIKIDVEGHEEKVFEGAWKTIEKNRPILFFESFVRRPPFLTRLKELNYTLFDVDNLGFPDDSTNNYVAVQTGSPSEELVKKHLLIQQQSRAQRNSAYK